MKIHNAATVFSVKNVGAALTFYTELLGFTEEFRFGEYAGIARGGACIHLSQNPPGTRPVGAGSVYVFCDEVDEYYRAITGRGVRTLTEPRDWPYGMRDFTAFDPDGNQISFGTGCGKG